MISSNSKVKEFFNAIRSKIEITEHCFNTGASQEQLNHLEVMIGYELPLTYKELLRFANGEGEKRLLTMGLFFSSVQNVIAEIERFKSYEDHKPDSLYQDGMVKASLYNPKRLPFASDQSGQYLCIDFDPDKNGKFGQVIYLPSAEPEPISVIANSFDEFLDFIISAINNNQLSVYDERDDWDEDDWDEWREDENEDLRKVDVYFEKQWRDDWTDIAEDYNRNQ